MSKKTLPSIPLSEYADRRGKVLKALGRSIGVIFAGEQADPLHDDFHPHPHFTYLTGLIDEPGAVLVLDPSAPTPARREMLFLRPLNPELEQWDGLRDPISSKLRDSTGFKTIFRTLGLPRFLTEAACRARSLACLHPIAYYNQPVSPDLDLFRKVAERVPGTEIIDRTEVLARLRAVKSAKEAAMIKHAGAISALGYDTVLSSVEPGMSEADVQEMLHHAWRTNGSTGPGYGTIVGSGINSTVLHYRANNQVIEDGDLICIDGGAMFGSYMADITRTFPANGTFTDRQKEIYSIVLRALSAGIKTAKAGATFAQIDNAARKIITKAGYGDNFIHGIGHNLGLEVHDITPEGPLKAGNVITIEPGIYIPEEKLGVRIEDNVVITKDGCRNLTAGIPKTIAAIEKAMASR